MTGIFLKEFMKLKGIVNFIVQFHFKVLPNNCSSLAFSNMFTNFQKKQHMA